jgi:hypothetical protein
MKLTSKQAHILKMCREFISLTAGLKMKFSVCVSKMPTSVLMTETELAFETLVFNPALSWLVKRQFFSTGQCLCISGISGNMDEETDWRRKWERLKH